MKKLLYIVFVSMVALLGVACDSDDEKVVVEKGLVGEWQLVEWESNAELPFEVYLALHSNGRFELYQKIENLTFEKFTGKYRTKKGLFEGMYDNGQPLSAEYDYLLSETKNQLQMVSRSEHPETMVYARVQIPDNVKQSAQVTRSESRVKAIL